MALCFVTGSNGFIGTNLVERLLELGNTVVALAKNTGRQNFVPTRSIFLTGLYIPISGDILDRLLILELFKKYNFHEVYHLAGQSSPSDSWNKPIETMEINFSGTINILDSALQTKANPVIVLVSSSAVYSPQRDSNPIKECGECKPVTPYGISKLAMDQLASVYSQAYGMRVCSARPFFIIGPGKINDVCSDWASSVALIERGKLNSLSVGEIEGISRDFLSVSDAVSALIKIASKGQPGSAYNICSGNPLLLIKLLEIFKINSTSIINIEFESSKFRPIEELIKVGSNEKILSLGWTQEENIENCILNILNYWRKIIIKTS
jgi:GDP-4-dehydro-6-deoxy-D-mannose reductase